MIFNYFFTSVFILEAAMKIVALGFFRYIKDRYENIQDNRISSLAFDCKNIWSEKYGSFLD